MFMLSTLFFKNNQYKVDLNLQMLSEISCNEIHIFE